MAQSKSTKKFEKKHLKDVLTRRKDFAKIKQRHQVNAKRKEKNAKNKADEDGEAAASGQATKRQKQETSQLGEMNVDDFFATDFDIKPKLPNGTSGAKRSGKRKRNETAEGAEDDASVASVEDHAFAETSGSEADEEDTNGVGMHQSDLKALQQKDPEFYKYLQENDAELLDFAETSNLDEIDELSEEDTEKAKKGKKKNAEIDDATMPGVSENKITTAVIKKWASAMSTQHSLRAMREVVLAFRAAAHLNEEDGKEYKYTISDADGWFLRESSLIEY